MDWQKKYKSGLITAEEAALKVKSGDFIVIHGAASVPVILTEGMVKRDDVTNVELIHMGIVSPAAYCNPELAGKFRLRSPFIGLLDDTRRAVNEGRADYWPLHFSEVPKLLRDHKQPDVVFLQVAPPDNHGYCNLGVTVDYAFQAVKSCKRVVIAQVNKLIPRTYGDTNVHVSEIDYFVECDRQLPQFSFPAIDDVSAKIGKNVASLINDRACLQLGTGAIPEAALKQLADRKDLGIHTEMFSNQVLELVKKGVVTGKFKNIDNGKIVSTFLVANDESYNFVNENPSVLFKPVDYTNDPYVIGSIDNFVSIQSCVQVDLLGQVCSDTLGYKQFSGVGGQVDFIRGAFRSKNGKSILAITSTTAKGTVSRIVPILSEGAVVTTSRYDVHYVVTEYGVADLKYKTVRERVKALIAIAHPNFRDELEAIAKKRNIF